MKHFTLHRIAIALLFICAILTEGFSEGSRDFIGYPGERLFFHAQVPQQLKVYVAENEFLNFGASHVGITGGFITVYRPDGSVHSRYDNTGATEGLAIINNHIEERNGPTGGGTLNGQGYRPGVIQAGAGEEGVWTFTLEFPSYNIATFINLQNDAPWSRTEHQPLIQRVITSWDITVSQNAAANNGGQMLEGRVYTNEYGAIVNQVTASTSPLFYVLTKDGIEYEVIFGEVNPWGFQINSSSKGVLDGRKNPYYKSAFVDDITRVASLEGLDPDRLYLYEPQAEDKEEFINNKIFFNPPSRDLPAEAIVTDIVRNNTHITWLLFDVNTLAVAFDFLSLSPVQAGAAFLPDGVMDVDFGANFIFNLNRQVSAQVLLDLNYDGDYDDEVDRALYKTIGPGIDSILWDARDGLGDKISPQPEPITVDFKFIAGQGEIHIALADIEENPGGIIFRRLNGADAPAEGVIYNHTEVGAGISGGTLPYLLDYTTEPFTYTNYFGNRKYLDYYSFEALPFLDLSTDILVVKEGYSIEDTDFDGIPDSEDIDDDNDGIPDDMEYCGLSGGADCFEDGLAPWEDNDGDGVKNYLDNDDPSFSYDCDTIEFGVCREVRSIYDYDGDGRPNHLDSDSDNDGILDVAEAGHGALDLDRDGIIDGPVEDFGANGLYNELSSDPSAIDADIIYQLLDSDGDGVPNFRDLDSDNDGIPEVIENQLYSNDTNIDGRLEEGNLMESIEEYFRGIPIAVHHYLLDTIPVSDSDQDGDGIPNHLDLDSDNDGIYDVAEGNYPDDDNDGIYGSGIPQVNRDGIPSIDDKIALSPSGEDTPFYFVQYDFDQDLIPDFLDLDSDNDGLHDVREANFSDSDNDGFLGRSPVSTGNTGITIADAILVPFMITSEPMDWDKDGFADYKDLDADNDGIQDVLEHNLEDADNDGFVGSAPQVNEFGQIIDAAQVVVVTSNEVDTDKDGVPDFRDRDSDNDGIHDVAEAGLPDLDNDAVIGSGTSVFDNYGRDQTSYTSQPGDNDGDGIWNFRDLDSDNDGLLDVYEAGNTDGDYDGIFGVGTPTVDSYGIPVADGTDQSTSTPIDSDSDGIPDYLSLDSDSDRIPDVIEAKLLDPDFDGLLGVGIPSVDENGMSADPNASPPLVASTDAPDTDGDGLEDFRDVDSDNDGLLDIDECPTLGCRDLDQDGLEDFRDADRDGDGLPDSFECSDGSNCADLDMDGLPNVDDLDSDGDQLSDAEECPGGTSCPDADGSSVVDVYEFTCHNAIAPNLINATESKTYCAGTDIVLSAENNGNTEGDLIYTWTLPNGVTVENTAVANTALEYIVESASMSAAGEYTLVSRAENGCLSASVTVSVEIIDQPIAAVVSAENKEVCAGGIIEIDAMTTASPGLAFDWYFDNGTENVLIQSTTSPTLIIQGVSESNEGSYSLVISGPNCTSPPSNIEYITIKPTIVEATAFNNSTIDNPVCSGSPLSLFADDVIGANYLWTGPNGFSSTEQNPILENITSTNSGTYSYAIEVPGCQIVQSSETEVFIQDIGPKPIIDGEIAVCLGGESTLEVINTYDPPPNGVVLYEWYTAPSGNLIATNDSPILNLDIVDNIPTTYYVEVVQGECRTAPSDLFDITIEEAPNEVAYIPQDVLLICDESEIEIAAAVPMIGSGEWTSDSGVTIINPNMSITVVTDLIDEAFTLVWTLTSGACENYSSDTLFVERLTTFTLMDDLLNADLNGVVEDYDVIVNDDLPVGATYSVSIQSLPSNGTASITSDGLLTYTPNSGYVGSDELTYEVCIDNCTQSCETAKIIFNVQPTDCAIPNIMTPNEDGLNDTFIVPCANQHTDNEVAIFNRWGDKVFAAKKYKNDWDGRYRGNELPPGTYYYIYKSSPSADTEQTGFLTLVR